MARSVGTYGLGLGMVAAGHDGLRDVASRRLSVSQSLETAAQFLINAALNLATKA